LYDSTAAETVFLNFLMSPGTDSKDSIPPAYEAWRGGAVRQHYWFQATINCYKIPAQLYISKMRELLKFSAKNNQQVD
jgi:hypothetical protein